MQSHMKSVVFLLTALLITQGACRRKDKPNVLALIPEDAPVVAWMPEPKGTAAALRSFLVTFERENLGDQVKALRFEWKKQYGVDPLDEQSLIGTGLDIEKPWALAYDKTLTTPVYFLQAKDPDKVLGFIKKLMKDGWLIDAPTVRGEKKIQVFSQPFGNAQIEVAAVKVTDTSVWIALGPQASSALEAWPDPKTFTGKEGAPRNFQKAWKKAESDGSPAGAALRIVAKDSAQVLPKILAGKFAKDAELRAVVSVKEHRLELFAALLGKTDLRPLFAEEKDFAPGVGLPEKPIVVARSQLNAGELYSIAVGLRLLQPLLKTVIGLDESRVESLINLGTGAGMLAIELAPEAIKNSKARSTAERLRTLLDAFPITAVAQLKSADKFDAMLPALETELKKRGLPATLDRSDKAAPILRTPSLSPESEVSLSRRGNTLIYGIGPGAFASARSRVEQKKGMDRTHPIFGVLFEPMTSGAIMDVSTLVQTASTLPELIFGDQNALMKNFFGTTMKSFAHFEQAGMTLGLEGPAFQPHPVLRLWITTK
jgi:hypothetical protein